MKINYNKIIAILLIVFYVTSIALTAAITHTVDIEKANEEKAKIVRHYEFEIAEQSFVMLPRG